MPEDYPPLLRDGLHRRSLAELESLCVTPFVLSQRRPELMAGLCRLVAKLEAAGLCGDLLTDGSFLTEKIDPADVDVALQISAGDWDSRSADHSACIAWLSDPARESERRTDYGCHTFVFVDLPPSHPEYFGMDMKAYWCRQFGHDRAGRSKGIAVIPVNGGAR